MRYLESWDDIKSKVDTLKTLVSIHHRRSTPTENYEDCFLLLKETEGFFMQFERPEYGYVKVSMYKLVNDDDVEEEFSKYLSELNSIKYRLIKRMFKCHFSIELNGKSQADLNPNTHKTDDFKFKGVGDKYRGYDGEGIYHNTPIENKVFVKISFFIV